MYALMYVVMCAVDSTGVRAWRWRGHCWCCRLHLPMNRWMKIFYCSCLTGRMTPANLRRPVMWRKPGRMTSRSKNLRGNSPLSNEKIRSSKVSQMSNATMQNARIEKTVPGGMRCRFWLQLVLTLALSALAGLAWADPVTWQQLSDSERQLLQRFESRWDEFTPEQQARLRQGADRWSSMTPEQRQRARQEFGKWKQLTPEQREKLREAYQRFKALPPEQRQKIREARQRFRQLPPERQQRLRERWRNMSPEQRQRFKQRWRKRRGQSD